MRNWFIGTGLIIAGAVGVMFVNNTNVSKAWLVMPIVVILLGASIKVRELCRCKHELDTEAERHGRLFG